MNNRFLVTICCLMLSLMASAQASGGQISRKQSKVTKVIQKSSNNGSRHNIKRSSKDEDELEKKYSEMSMASLERYAKKGDAMAQFYLGHNYANKEDYKNAVGWFIEASYNGLVRAQLWLAYCYYNGLGVNKDKIGAREWLKEAASKGSPEAKEYLRTWYDE